MGFGMTSFFLSGMKIADQDALSMKYGFPRKTLLTAVRNLNNVRNMCAHHSRIWNRSPADQISCPKHGEAVLLDHLVPDRMAQSRIYATAAVIQFFLRTIHPASTWGERMKKHFGDFPTSAVSTVSQAGFPYGWETLPLWN
jgi:abortive infection bacteriophage resistance protein